MGFGFDPLHRRAPALRAGARSDEAARHMDATVYPITVWKATKSFPRRDPGPPLLPDLRHGRAHTQSVVVKRLKFPVRLVRAGEEPTFGVLKISDPRVRTVVVDTGTRQLFLRGDRVLRGGEGSPYRVSDDGDVEVLEASNRLGRLFLSLDRRESSGYPGHVAFGGSVVEMRETVPSADGDHRIGSADLVSGGHRLILDLEDRRLLVQ